MNMHRKSTSTMVSVTSCFACKKDVIGSFINRVIGLIVSLNALAGDAVGHRVKYVKRTTN